MPAYLYKLGFFPQTFFCAKENGNFVKMQLEIPFSNEKKHHLFIFFQTLANSELAQLNPNTTTETEIKQAFCRDFAKVQRSYEVNIN